MPELSDAALVAALRRHMTVAAARQVVAASNLANASTPGYKAQEIDFTQTLDRQMSGGLPMAVTAKGHQASDTPSSSALPTKDVSGATPRRDGNTVQLDRELLTMTSAAGEFGRAQTALAAKFRLLRYAINEGK